MSLATQTKREIMFSDTESDDIFPHFVQLCTWFLCVCVTVHRTVECVRIMRWRSSNLGQ